MKPSISIVIPSYNVEKFISKTIDSVLNQTISDIEIILVDDGSTDNSLKIMNAYQERFNNIKVIHQENGGTSKARNTGIENANGEYITFVDSDDFIEKDMCEILLNNAKEIDADISIVGIEKIEIDGKIKNSYKNDKIKKYNKLECLSHFLKNDDFESYSCGGKAFRRNIYESIRFEVGKKSNEDRFYLFQAISKANKIAVQNINKYRYIMRLNSQSTSSVDIRLFDNIYFVDLIDDYIINKENSLVFESLYNKVITYMWVYRNMYRHKFAIKKYNTELKKLRVKISELDVNKIKLSKEKLIEYYIIKYFNFVYYIILKIGDKLKRC